MPCRRPKKPASIRRRHSRNQGVKRKFSCTTSGVPCCAGRCRPWRAPAPGRCRRASGRSSGCRAAAPRAPRRPGPPAAAPRRAASGCTRIQHRDGVVEDVRRPGSGRPARAARAASVSHRAQHRRAGSRASLRAGTARSSRHRPWRPAVRIRGAPPPRARRPPCRCCRRSRAAGCRASVNARCSADSMARAPSASAGSPWRTASQSSIIATDRIIADGLAMPLPAMSGAVPWAGWNKA